MAVDAILDPGPLTDEERPPVEQLSPPARVEVRHPNRRQQIAAKQFAEFPGIDDVRLRSCLPNQFDLIGIGDVRGVPRLLQPRYEPFPLECGFHGDHHRPR